MASDVGVGAQAREVELKLKDIFEKFRGDRTKPSRQEPGYPGMTSRLRTIVSGSFSGTMGPTKTHEKLYKIVGEEFSEVLKQLKQVVEKDIPALNKKLDSAKAPWTPGRKIPDWKVPK